MMGRAAGNDKDKEKARVVVGGAAARLPTEKKERGPLIRGETRTKKTRHEAVIREFVQQEQFRDLAELFGGVDQLLDLVCSDDAYYDDH